MIDDPVVVDDWHVVARSEDITDDEPFGARVLEEDLVIWRNNGSIMAWKDLCLHRGTRLSMGDVRDGKLECPYHGWIYNEDGRCVEIPAHPDQPPPKRFETIQYHVKEQYDLVWVCLGEPDQDPPEFPEWDKEEYRTIFCGPYEFEASAPRAVENFLDVAHFPFVHEGTLGVRERPEIPDYDVKTNEHGIEATNVKVFQPDPDGTGQGSFTNYTYKVLRPFTPYISKLAGDHNYTIYAPVTPIDKAHCKMWVWQARNFGHDIPEEELQSRQDEITLDDVPIVESQRPELLPLDLQAELHRPSDKVSIAYRKWLNKKGLTFGTA